MKWLHRHWLAAVVILAVVALYLWFTRIRVVGMVDVSGEGMTVTGARG